MRGDSVKLSRWAATRSAAQRMWPRRSPRLLPKATATRPAIVGSASAALIDPAGRQHDALRAGAVRAPAEQIGAARQGLLEEALLLERLAKDDPQHRAETCIGHVLDAVTPAVDEGLRLVAVLADDPRLRVLFLARGLDRRLGRVFGSPAMIGDGVVDPRQVHVLAVDHVLVGVVEVVVHDEACGGHVTLPQRGLLAVELAQQLEQFG